MTRGIVIVALVAGILAGCVASAYMRPSKDSKEAYLVAHPETPPEYATAIRESKWALGMSKEQVLASLNHPYSISTYTDKGLKIETWEYRNISFASIFLTFEDGVLASWSSI